MWYNRVMDQTDEAIIQCIAAHTKEAGYPPTLKEIGEAVGLVKSGVWYRVRKLSDAGVVERTPGRARSLRLSKWRDPTRRKP